MATDSTSGISSNSGANALRITGTSSGLDVDEIVKKLMTVEQTKVDKIAQDKQIIQWKQDAYKDIISDIKSLQSSFFDVTSSDTNMMASSNYIAASVTGNNSAVGNITALAGAQLGNYTLQVDKIAAGANFTQSVTGATSIVSTSKLTDITNGSAVITDLKKNLSFVIDLDGGKTLNISIDNSAGNLTVKDLVNAVNVQGSGYIKASYSELTHKFSLGTIGTGNDKTLKINAAGTSTSLNELFGTVDVTGNNADVWIKPPGEVAKINVTNQSTNNFNIDGMNYNLTGVTTTTGDITLSVAQDTQKVYDKFTKFLEKYNTLVNKIQTKLSDKKNKDYAPLTDAQKTSMSETQINTWNTKAQVGVLRNDNLLQKMLTDLKSAFTTSVTGVNLSIGKYGPNSFGLDTSSDYNKPYEIKITDPTKFKSAIVQNGDEFMKLFTNVSTSTNDVTKNKENGIFTRIQTIIQNNVGKTGVSLNSAILTKYSNYQDNYSTSGAGGLNTLPDQMYAKDILIKNLNTKFSTMQSSYYSKFSKLESAMAKLNGQSSAMTSMLGQ